MTDQEKNAEIARRLGWLQSTANDDAWCPPGEIRIVRTNDLPDYLHSCCACKEIKAWLSREGFNYIIRRHTHGLAICDITYVMPEDPEALGLASEGNGMAATEERALCEAFLMLEVEND